MKRGGEGHDFISFSFLYTSKMTVLDAKRFSAYEKRGQNLNKRIVTHFTISLGFLFFDDSQGASYVTSKLFFFVKTDYNISHEFFMKI